MEIELTGVQAPDDLLNRSSHLITEIKERSDIETEWLIKESEKWCQEKAIYGAIMDSIQIIDGKKPELQAGAIPDILSQALGVSFDQDIGHDYIDNSEEIEELEDIDSQKDKYLTFHIGEEDYASDVK